MKPDSRPPAPGPAGLDRRIDRSLRRLYRPPSELERHFELPPATTAEPRLHQPWTLAGAAAAALVLSLAASWLARPRPVLESGPAAPRIAAVSAPRAMLAVGPLEDPRQAPEVRCADLADLYRSMDAAQRSSAVAACGADDQLAQRLKDTYGQGIQLQPGALGQLHGPFASPEWPTGTILTGVAEDETSVIVAEYHDALTCCLSMDLPDDSPLRVFSWKFGDVVLTEITPAKEPRLIDYFTGAP